MKRFLFVGERPSHRAVALRVTWLNGALAAATLFRALRTLGFDPHEQRYCNLYTSPTRGAGTDASDERKALRAVRGAAECGWIVIGMGRIVQRVLARERVPHLQLRHPAARGKERRHDLFHAHVQEVFIRYRSSVTQR